MSQSYAPVWAVCKDPGGTAGVLPVVQQLKARGITVQVIANGHASKSLHHGARVDVLSYRQALDIGPLPRVLITDMSSCGGVGRDLVPHVRGKSTIFALQDFWGGEMTHSWADEAYRPDYLCVNDTCGVDIACAAWPKFERDRVLVTGYPALDKYANIDVDAAHQKVRQALGLVEDLPMVVFMGQGQATAHALGEVTLALGELGQDCYFMPRPHPRTKDDFGQEMAPWQEVLSRYKGRLVVDWFSKCTLAMLVAACAKRRGVVVSMYSTALVEAACVRAQNIAVLYPKHGMRVFEQAVPHLGAALSVALGCAPVAHNADRLKYLLSKALAGKLELEERQSMYFRGDGRNAERVAQEVIKHL